MTDNEKNSKRNTPALRIAGIILIVVLGVLTAVQTNRLIKYKEKMADCENGLTRYDSLLRAKNLELTAWKDVAGQMKTEENVQDSGISHYKYDEGIFFEVQIGSFTDFDLDEYMNEMVEIRQEKDGLSTKLLLGRFRSIKQARLFENDMKRIGLNDAFVIGRVNNRLVPVDDAIAALRAENKP